MFDFRNMLQLTPIEKLGTEERFRLINSKYVPPKVVDYLESILANLTINVCGDCEGDILSLMHRGRLEGWCWQTTESAIVFFNDDDYIERGHLMFDKYKDYYHSWICFKFRNVEYVFDPCLNLLCKKVHFDKIFAVKKASVVSAKEVRDALIDEITNPKPKREDNSEAAIIAKRVMRKIFGDLVDKHSNEVVVSGNNDVNSPMYRNYTGYEATIEDGKILRLKAHYYLNA